MVIWIIGLSGAGKTTIGKEVYTLLKNNAPNTVLVDGDDIRAIFQHTDTAAYTLEGRRLNAQRIRALCQWLDNQNIHVVCPILSIFEEDRQKNRASYSRYFEVYLETDFSALIKRDSKHLYQAALSGQKKHVVGIDIPFEPPRSPDLILQNNVPFTDPHQLAIQILEHSYALYPLDFNDAGKAPAQTSSGAYIPIGFQEAGKAPAQASRGAYRAYVSSEASGQHSQNLKGDGYMTYVSSEASRQHSQNLKGDGYKKNSVKQIEYPYASGSLLEQPNTYFYSVFQGSNFIQAWKDARETILHTCGETTDLKKYPLDLTPSPTRFFLEKICADIDQASITWEGKQSLDALLRNFEAKKRIYQHYTPEFTSKGQTDHHELGLYLLFSETLLKAWHQWKTLPYLNGLIKCIDILCAHVNDLNIAEKHSLAETILAERSIIDQLATSLGLMEKICTK